MTGMAEKQLVETRDALRMLAPGPVTLVTTIYRDQPNVMTAGWHLPLSLDPTLIGVAIQPSRLTHEFITRTESFAINIPNVDLMSAVHACGMVSGREKDKFAESGLTPADAAEIDAPLIEQCVGHIECGVIDRFALGDHDLFVGRILAVHAVEEAFNGFWDVEVDAGRLLHHLGADRYAGLGRSYRVTPPDEEG
jgi:flavin reductase (DIM6/NTAB) family NADH-FMN oxidoreductase RutF